MPRLVCCLPRTCRTSSSLGGRCWSWAGTVGFPPLPPARAGRACSACPRVPHGSPDARRLAPRSPVRDGLARASLLAPSSLGCARVRATMPTVESCGAAPLGDPSPLCCAFGRSGRSGRSTRTPGSASCQLARPPSGVGLLCLHVLARGARSRKAWGLPSARSRVPFLFRIVFQHRFVVVCLSVCCVAHSFLFEVLASRFHLCSGTHSFLEARSQIVVQRSCGMSLPTLQYRNHAICCG